MSQRRLLVRYLDMPGKKKSHSIKKKDTYEALKRKGMPKSRAAAISNAQAKKQKSKKK